MTTTERTAACTGKRAFATYAEGQRVIRRHHRSDNFAPTPGERLTLYRCRYCPAWHIGAEPWPAPLRRRVLRVRVGGAK